MKLEANLQKLKQQLKSAKQAMVVGPRPLERVITPSETPMLIVDGGIEHWREKPAHALWIGDGDSCDQHRDHSLFDLFLPQNKDRSDLAYALSILPENLEELELLGFRDGRFDHQLMVLGELYSFLKTHPQCQIKLGLEIIGFAPGLHELEHVGLFSVLSLETLRLTINGAVEFEACDLTLSPFSSHALSNRASGKLTIESDKPFFFYSCP